MLKRSSSLFKLLIVSVFFSLSSLPATAADKAEWPQSIDSDKGTITVYQPQPEALKGKRLSGRAAMSIQPKNQKDPIWGVFWFEGDIETDRDDDSATISNIEVTAVRWPDSKDAGEERFAEFADKELEDSVFTTSITQLKATLAASDKAQKSLDDLKHDAPDIIFSSELAVLLGYDGKPKFQAIENSTYLRAVNTPLAVASNKEESEFYLTSGNLWYQASDPMGPWTETKKVPADLAKLVEKQESETANTKVPIIITSTEPTELISTDGNANWKSLVGGKLMYVENTETPWIREIASGDMYILLSGRWFSSGKEAGPWNFVRSDKLPKSFTEIPPESELGGLRTSVAGTDEANEAVMDTQIPQTAAVKRNGTTITVTYDGEPKFEVVKGTEVSYAVNTASQVLLINKEYYAVEDAIWYTSAKASGPWVVAEEVPANEIAKIPPSSPVYNTTYVNIYGSTNEVVYVGYTPGYHWSYAYYGVPVYGTGWYYPPYYSAYYYYPYPRTWGMHVGYNPYGGWSYGVSWGSPFFRVGVVWGGHYNRGYYGGYHHHNNIVINNNGNINIGNTINIDKNRTNNIRNNRTNNIYKDGRVKDKISTSPSLKDRDFKSSKVVDRANNVLADRDGNVVRKDNDKWQSMNNGKWQDVKTNDVSRGQAKDRATDFTRDNNSIRSRDVSRSSNINSSTVKNRTSTMNRSDFNHNNMNRQYNARSRSRSSFSGGRGRGGGRR
ncbi:MAG: carbohydrate-binding family V/XII [Oceanicoccus sp.]